jgi:hypothetical protein
MLVMEELEVLTTPLALVRGLRVIRVLLTPALFFLRNTELEGVVAPAPLVQETLEVLQQAAAPALPE